MIIESSGRPSSFMDWGVRVFRTVMKRLSERVRDDDKYLNVCHAAVENIQKRAPGFTIIKWWWECTCGQFGYGEDWRRIFDAAYRHVASREASRKKRINL